MKNKLLVNNQDLQKAIDYFIDDINANINIDLNKEILPIESIDEYLKRADEFFDAYEVNNYKLLILGAELYTENYNFLDLVLENSDPNPLLVNQALEQYVLDKVNEHQLELQKQIEKEKNNGKQMLSEL